MPDIELGEFAGGGEEVGIDFLDIPGHSIADVGDELIHVRIRAFHHQLNPAIGEIADVSTNIVPLGDVPHGVPETDALHVAGEIAGFPMAALGHRHRRAIYRKRFGRGKAFFKAN
jgi:hypothetical protein